MWNPVMPQRLMIEKPKLGTKFSFHSGVVLLWYRRGKIRKWNATLFVRDKTIHSKLERNERNATAKLYNVQVFQRFFSSDAKTAGSLEFFSSLWQQYYNREAIKDEETSERRSERNTIMRVPFFTECWHHFSGGRNNLYIANIWILAASKY